MIGSFHLTTLQYIAKCCKVIHIDVVSNMIHRSDSRIMQSSFSWLAATERNSVVILYLPSFSLSHDVRTMIHVMSRAAGSRPGLINYLIDQ